MHPAIIIIIGRTPIHTACSAGRSPEVLQWLFKVEEASREQNGESSTEQSITLRTDYPGGALALHSIAACTSFDTISTSDCTNHHPLTTYPLLCEVTDNVISAYESTTIIRNEYPQAILEVDCEGEIPLHAAASWGSVGSVFSLLVGAGDIDNHGFARAALTRDDRGKTPLDRACERLCSMSMARDSPRASTNSNSRQSLIRDDPFDTTISNSLDEGRASLQRNSSQRSRRRIPGCGSSFRASLSSSFVLGRGDSTGDIGEQLLRDSFVSPRRQVDPVYGLELLDCDGIEELAKIELLARAGYGFFETTMSHNNDNFQFLHAVIALGCSPEIIWHVCATKKHQVEEKDEFCRTPLILACERFASLYSQQHNKKVSSGMGKPLHEQSDYTNEGVADTGNEESMDEACCSVVESLLTGGNLLKNSQNVSESSTNQPQLQRTQERTNVDEVESEASSDNNIKEQLSLSKEVITILLKSSLFGRPNMASVTNSEGRLPLHIILEAGVQWVDNDEDITEDDSYKQSSNVVQLLVDVCPYALEIKDGISGLYPFMLAATAKDTSESDVEEEDTKQLETIFQLLLKAPNTISSCT